MKRNLLIAIIGLFFSQQVEAAHIPSLEARAAFRHAVEEYQVFVVPRCAPQEVGAYIAARKKRDHSFVQSLRNTKLIADYMKAVADRAEQDRHTAVHCFGPPPPPPPPPGKPSPHPILDAKPKSTLLEHFTAGDQQFAVMTRLRDAALGVSNNWRFLSGLTFLAASGWV